MPSRALRLVLSLTALAIAACGAPEDDGAVEGSEALSAEDLVTTRTRTDRFPIVVKHIEDYASTSLACTNAFLPCRYTVTLTLLEGAAAPLRLVWVPSIPPGSTWVAGPTVERRLASLGPEATSVEVQVGARSADRVGFLLLLERIPAKGEAGPPPFTVTWTVTRTQ